MPIAVTQKYVLIYPDITGWGVAYAMCVASFWEAPFTMMSLVALIVTTITFAHNTLSGVLLRLKVEDQVFWYRVVVGVLSVASIVALLTYWELMPHWISSSYCGDGLSPTLPGKGPKAHVGGVFQLSTSPRPYMPQQSQVIVSQALTDASIHHSQACANLDAAIRDAASQRNLPRVHSLVKQAQLCRDLQSVWETVRNTASLAHANTDFSLAPGQSTAVLRDGAGRAASAVIEPVAKAVGEAIANQVPR